LFYSGCKNNENLQKDAITLRKILSQALLTNEGVADGIVRKNRGAVPCRLRSNRPLTGRDAAGQMLARGERNRKCIYRLPNRCRVCRNEVT